MQFVPGLPQGVYVGQRTEVPVYDPSADEKEKDCTFCEPVCQTIFQEHEFPYRHQARLRYYHCREVQYRMYFRLPFRKSTKAVQK